jgi:PAS domain S-box-containing protein
MDKNNISSVKIILIFILFSIGIIISFAITDKIFFGNQTVKIALDNGKKKIFEREKFFKSFLNNGISNLLAIRQAKSFNNYLHNQKDNDVEDLFMGFTLANQDIMQLRYIDKNGLEKIRIDRKKDGEMPFFIPNEKLQDKSNRYYFSSSKEKPLEKVWFSALDLNVENKKVEIPYRSTLRAILPISKNGQFNGILIINYFMDSFLKELFNAPLYEMILADEKGYTLKHFDTTKSWGFYQEPKYTLQNEFPNTSNDIFNNELFSDKHLVSKKLSLPLQNNLILILQLSDKYVQKQQEEELRKYIIDSLIVLLFGILASILLSSSIKKLYINYFKAKHQLEDANKLTVAQSKILLQQKEEFETIFHQAKDGIAILDLDSNFLNFNDAYLEITEFTREELLTKSCIGLSSPQDVQRSINILKEVIAKGFITNYEKTCVVKDGKVVNVNMSITLMPDKKRFLLSVKNVTDSKLLESQSKLASMGEMIGNIAHQWRQPLSVISTVASGIAFKQENNFPMKPEDITTNMDTIISQTIYLSKTIDDFRNFIRSSGEESIIDIQSLVEKTLSIVNSTLKNNYIQTICTIEECLEIVGFENELMQAFINIINNAKDAINDNLSQENERYIFITAYKVNENIEIEFKDNANGINPTVINRIFEPYFTTKHQSVGTGLGLAMAYKIITERHKGLIEVPIRIIIKHIQVLSLKSLSRKNNK